MWLIPSVLELSTSHYSPSVSTEARTSLNPSQQHGEFSSAQRSWTENPEIKTPSNRTNSSGEAGASGSATREVGVKKKDQNVCQRKRKQVKKNN